MRGQTPPPAAGPPQPQQPTFRARVDSVSVDVIVTDRQGKPVTDLKAEDFEIKEADKVQKIDTFKFIAIDDDAGRRSADTREILSLAEQQRETANEREPDLRDLPRRLPRPPRQRHAHPRAARRVGQRSCRRAIWSRCSIR